MLKENQSSLELIPVDKNNMTELTITVPEEYQSTVTQQLDNFDFKQLQPTEILKLGFDAEKGLQNTLDNFLGLLDKNSASEVFQLLDQLNKGVDDANLPEVLEKIKNYQPGWFARLLNKIRGRTPADLAQKTFETTRDLIVGKTKTLADEMRTMESALLQKMQALNQELQTQEKLKVSYGKFINEFAKAAYYTHLLYEKAKVQVNEECERLKDSKDPNDIAYLSDIKNKLQMLQSRALTLEGVYTNLPNDQQLIQHIQQAGLTTLQETASTATTRFNNIKMSLLSVHTAFIINGVNKINEKSMELDSKLNKVKFTMMKEASAKAALAPGQNRLLQAESIEQMIINNKEIKKLVEEGRKTSQANMDLAKSKFAQARRELLNQGSN